MTVDDALRSHVFISYARDDDEPFVNRLRTDLTAAGIAIWWDRACMDSRGRHYLHEIQEAIQECDRMIAVIGPRAVTSDYVRYEWEHAMLFARAMVPILRIGRHEDFANRATVGDAFGLSEDLLQLHWTDFRTQRDYGDALAELIRQLQTPVGSLGQLRGRATAAA